jgi:propionyl-CoA synthetase
MTYGSFIRSCSTVLFEGKPIIPDAGILWKLCEKYKIDHLFVTPTAIREIIKIDNSGNFIQKYDTSNINII